jgi:acyl carrier protein
MKTFEEIIHQVFKVPVAEVHDEMSSQNISDWDSMNYLLLIAELEKRFGLSFTMDEAMNSKCVGDIRSVIKARATIA